MSASALSIRRCSNLHLGLVMKLELTLTSARRAQLSISTARARGIHDGGEDWNAIASVFFA